MSDDFLAGRGMLVLIIGGVGLFFATCFGNALSIFGVIVLIMIGVVLIVKLVNMLNKSRQEATKYRIALEIEQQKEKERQEREKREKEQPEKEQREKEKLWYSVWSIGQFLYDNMPNIKKTGAIQA
jgi:predicted lipid-binding transport protein (Tim44 family)